MTHFDFRNQNIIVTGGTGGLGRAVVARLIEAGAHCTIPVLKDEELEQFPYTDHDQATIHSGVDLTNAEQTEDFFKSATRDRGLHASLHLAGGFGMGSIKNQTVDDLHKMLQLNVLTCFNCCKNAIAVFREQNAGGRIVNVAARPAEYPRQGTNLSSYTASKGAVAALTQSLAQEVHGDGILINAVSPSIIDTPANRSAMPKADHDQWPKPEEIAETILFLSSSANRLTHGGIVPVHGKA